MPPIDIELIVVIVDGIVRLITGTGPG